MQIINLLFAPLLLVSFIGMIPSVIYYLYILSIIIPIGVFLSTRYFFTTIFTRIIIIVTINLTIINIIIKQNNNIKN